MNEALTELISRYEKLLLTSPQYLPYWKNTEHWRAEINSKLKELKKIK